MRILFFISFCVIVPLLGCSPNNFEKGKTSSSSSLDDDDEWWENDPDWNTDIGDQVKNVCRRGDYVIYSPGECPDGEGGDSGNNHDLFMGDIHFGPGADNDLDLDPNDPTNPNTDPTKITRRPVDIFFIVSSNTSMWYYLNYTTNDKEKNRFQGRFRSFIPTLNQYNMDWRMFFTNSSYSGRKIVKERNGKAMKLDGQYGVLPNSKILDKNTNDYLNTFIYTITRGPEVHYERGDEKTCARPPYCGNVRPLRALRGSFSTNRRLTRDGADFVAVILSNRDEEQDKVSADDVIHEFRRVYGSHKKLFVLSLIILPGDSECYDKNNSGERTFLIYRLWQSAKYGDRISGLARRAGGGNFSICMRDYSVLAKTIVSLSSQ